MTDLAPATDRRPLLHPLGWLLIFLTALTAYRVAFIAAGVYELAGDECHYWEFSRRLDWCYFSKGPVVAWMIRLCTELLGHTELAVRLPAVLLSAATSLLIYWLGRRLHNATVGAWAGAIYQIVPIFAALSVGLTYDPPFLFLFVLATLITHAAARRPALWKWIALTLVIGLRLMTKYTMALFYPCALLYLLFDRDRRRLLLTPWPYLVVLVSFAFLTPLLMWNADHGWVNFAHNAHHTKLDEGLRFTPLKFLELLGSELAIVTPVLLVMMVIAQLKLRGRDPVSFWFSIPLLAFFAAKSFFGSVNANWPLPAYPVGLIAFVAFFFPRYRTATIHEKRCTRLALIIPIIGTLFLQYPTVVSHTGLGLVRLSRVAPDTLGPLQEWGETLIRKDPSRRLQGYSELADAVDRFRDRMDGDPFIVGADRLIPGRLAFYMRDNPVTYSFLEYDQVQHQYYLWPSYNNPAFYGRDAIYVTWHKERKAIIHPRFAAGFDRVQEHRVQVNDRFGRPLREFGVYLCYNFQGLPSRAEWEETHPQDPESTEQPTPK
jgi:undecaprenyl-diphosphatase